MPIEQADLERALVAAREAVEATPTEAILKDWGPSPGRASIREQLKSGDSVVRDAGRGEFFALVIPNITNLIQTGNIERMQAFAGQDEQRLTYSKSLEQKGCIAALNVLGIEIPEAIVPLTTDSVQQEEHRLSPKPAGWRGTFDKIRFTRAARREV